MNEDQVAGQWNQIKGKAKERWGRLTDDDLDVVEGKLDQLVGKIQKAYGLERERAQKQVDEFIKSYH